MLDWGCRIRLEENRGTGTEADKRDYRLPSIVWEAEPVASPELCRLAAAQLGWKRTTTYGTKKTVRQGTLRNKNTVVTSNINRETVQKRKAA